MLQRSRSAAAVPNGGRGRGCHDSTGGHRGATDGSQKDGRFAGRALDVSGRKRSATGDVEMMEGRTTSIRRQSCCSLDGWTETNVIQLAVTRRMVWHRLAVEVLLRSGTN